MAWLSAGTTTISLFAKCDLRCLVHFACIVRDLSHLWFIVMDILYFQRSLRLGVLSDTDRKLKLGGKMSGRFIPFFQIKEKLPLSLFLLFVPLNKPPALPPSLILTSTHLLLHPVFSLLCVTHKKFKGCVCIYMCV